MDMLAVPLLVELGLLASEPLSLQAAELAQKGCSETVAMPGRDCGYAADGLQEEGLLLS